MEKLPGSELFARDVHQSKLQKHSLAQVSGFNFLGHSYRVFLIKCEWTESQAGKVWLFLSDCSCLPSWDNSLVVMWPGLDQITDLEENEWFSFSGLVFSFCPQHLKKNSKKKFKIQKKKEFQSLLENLLVFKYLIINQSDPVLKTWKNCGLSA